MIGCFPWSTMSKKYYQVIYASPIGNLILLASHQALHGAWFQGQKYEKRGYEEAAIIAKSNAIIEEASLWLEAYFSGQTLPGLPALEPKGTDYQKRVWQELLKIPSGQTSTYGKLAQKIKCKSAQAVGGAVGRNPISIFIPCHRILGADGSLTGYAGGLERKKFLLELEKERKK